MTHCNYTSSTTQLKHELVLNMSSKLREPYDPKFKSSTNVHLGQRKLLLSEIQLLIEHYKTSSDHPVLMYVGAAPGTKNVILTKMFPKVKFILYDGAKFDPKLKRSQYKSVFELHEGEDGFFTTEKCKEIAKARASDKRPLLFVSDIRLGEGDFEFGVNRDMQLQMEWVKILKPSLSLLKFRFPYTMNHGETMSYLKGTILYGIWAKEQSGETRLLVRSPTMTKYDFKTYEQIMFFHNKYVRPYCFASEASRFEKYMSSGGYCSCFDCIAELKIIEEYLKLPQAACKTFESVIRELRMLGAIRSNKNVHYFVNLDAHLKTFSKSRAA